MERLTFYTHAIDLGYLHQQLAQLGPVSQPDAAQLLTLLVGPADAPVLRLGGRQRTQPDYQLLEIIDPLTENLAGMYSFVQQLPMADKARQQKLMAKVLTLNTEVTLNADAGFPAGFGQWLAPVLGHYEALVFAEPNSLYASTQHQGFYDPAGRLLTDTTGAGDPAADMPVSIESKYYDEADPLPDQLARKARSEEVLQAQGVPFAASLPPVASDTAAQLQPQDEVVNRVLALGYVALKGEGAAPDDLAGYDQAYGATAHLSPREQEFAETAEPARQDLLNATWRYEALHALLWALGYVPELSYPDHPCDPARDMALLAALSEVEFRAQAQLRPAAEVLEAADLTYRYSWACVDAYLKQQPAPGRLEAGVVQERLYALNWLTKPLQEEWDEVLTDT